MKKKLILAPMMGYTDAYFRYLIRCISPHIILYTEMVHANAINHASEIHRLLKHHPSEHPLVLQLGGSEPDALARAVERAVTYMQTHQALIEINLNVGCPSARVQQGEFGACLMLKPEVVRQCLWAMRQACDLPISVKTRLGVNECDDLSLLVPLMEAGLEAGCDRWILHARKAWLKGLNPKQNRDIPPLRYDQVFEIKKMFPKTEIILNGGLNTVEQIQKVLPEVDGVMLGRQLCNQPMLLQELEWLFFEYVGPSTPQVVQRYLTWIDDPSHTQHVNLTLLLKPLLSLFYGQPGAKAWRQLISHQIAQGRLEIEPLKAFAESLA